MPSRQDATLPRFHQRIWACRDYTEVTRLASQYSYEPLFVHKGCAEWCRSRGMTKEAAQHAVGPILLGLQYPNAYYDDVLDANAIGQCIFFLFETSYTGMLFHDVTKPLGGLNAWGKLFCLAYCYLSKSIQLLHAVPDRQMFEPYEARATLTMNCLGSRFDITFPYTVWSEMVAYDCLATGSMYEAAGYPEENEKWRALATKFITDKQRIPLQIESLGIMAKEGARAAHAFFKERESNFMQNKYLCTADEVKVSGLTQDVPCTENGLEESQEEDPTMRSRVPRKLGNPEDCRSRRRRIDRKPTQARGDSD